MMVEPHLLQALLTPLDSHCVDNLATTRWARRLRYCAPAINRLRITGGRSLALFNRCRTCRLDCRRRLRGGGLCDLTPRPRQLQQVIDLIAGLPVDVEIVYTPASGQRISSDLLGAFSCRRNQNRILKNLRILSHDGLSSCMLLNALQNGLLSFRYKPLLVDIRSLRNLRYNAVDQLTKLCRPLIRRAKLNGANCISNLRLINRHRRLRRGYGLW